MNGNSLRTIRDVTRNLQAHFSGTKIPLSLPSESRRMLQSFIDENHDRIDYEEATKANQELRQFWDRYVVGSPQKLGAFVGVLRELRPAIVNEDDLLEWYYLAAKPVVSSIGVKKTAVDDVQEFLTRIMIYDEDDSNAKPRSRTSMRICSDLLTIYLARTRGLVEEDQFVAPDNALIAQQVEGVLVAFGRKMPKQLFHNLDDLIARAETRLQGLTLLSSFLRHQTAHIYTVQHTPLIDNLLKCLMNDTSTTVLSMALTSLIMLLPHIPGSLNPRLPRLFLVYSRLLCWERFSALSTEAQKDLVTDDRVAASEYDGHGDVGIDPTWEKCRPRDGMIEASTPELKTYFTYLYGLYPINFMSYIRKPRRFLKNVDFPGADDFDLDQAVIRSRSDQFRQSHLLHPNFYNLTMEEELIDPKWPKMDPADVVAECHGLAIDSRSRSPLVSPGPPPTGKLPALPPLPPIPPSNNGSISPAISHTSLRSGNSWRDTQSTAVSSGIHLDDSPILGPQDDALDLLRPRSKAGVERMRSSLMLDEFPLPSSGFPGLQQMRDISEPPPTTNLAYLQREITLLRNDLNFEKWHKAQYSQHIGQLMRKNVKDATVEAETLNLINANRALKQQLEQVRGAREATIRDSNLTRKQANNLELNMTERFNKMKKEQETWAADADELRKLRTEMKTYRDLLSESEARELKTAHELELVKRNLGQLSNLETQLEESRRKIREYEYREWDFDQAKREHELLQSEKETLQMRIRRQEQDLQRTKQMYSERLVEMEASLGGSQEFDRPPTSMSILPGSTNQAVVQRELDDTKAKLIQLKKSHSRLLERYTDLEMEYQSVKSQLATLQGYGGEYGDLPHSIAPSEREPSVMSGALPGRPGVLESVYDLASEYGAPSELAFSSISRSDPTDKRYVKRSSTMVSGPYRGNMRGLPVSLVSPPRSEATIHSVAGLTWKPPTTSHTVKSQNSDVSGYNPTRPLGLDERSVVSGQSAGSGSAAAKKEKIDVKSEVRVYGRGGAQNIKLKAKDGKDGPSKPEKPKGFAGKLGKGLGLS